MFSKTLNAIGLTAILLSTSMANAAGIGSIGGQHSLTGDTFAQPILVAQKLAVAKSKKRAAETLRGKLAISPSAATADGYPTAGKAFEACGGAGNVFVMYDIGPDGQQSNHSFHCVD